MFEKGHPKYGGNKKGVPSKSSIVSLVREKHPDFHPVLAMIEMYEDPATPAEVRAKLLDSIASYTTPRLKAIDLLELLRIDDEALVGLVSGGDPIDTFIGAFLGGKLSANDLATLTAVLAMKQKSNGNGQTIDEQAELLSLIKR